MSPTVGNEDNEIMLWMHAAFFCMIGSNFSFVSGPAKWIVKWKIK